jgi:hypothetical protein
MLPELCGAMIARRPSPVNSQPTDQLFLSRRKGTMRTSTPKRRASQPCRTACFHRRSGFAPGSERARGPLGFAPGWGRTHGKAGGSGRTRRRACAATISCVRPYVPQLRRESCGGRACAKMPPGSLEDPALRGPLTPRPAPPASAGRRARCKPSALPSFEDRPHVRHSTLPGSFRSRNSVAPQ